MSFVEHQSKARRLPALSNGLTSGNVSLNRPRARVAALIYRGLVMVHIALLNVDGG